MINSTEIEILLNKASVLYNEQKYDEAIEYYDKALERDPADVIALNNKAIILYYLQRYDEALQYYDNALAINPSDEDTLYNKGIGWNCKSYSYINTRI